MTPPRGEVAELGDKLRHGLSCVELIGQVLTAAERARHGSGAFVSLRTEGALADASRADAELASGTDRGPLHGIPVTVKDNIDVAGCWTRSGTPGFGHRRAERDATVVARLRAAGAVVIGKTRMHELAWGMVTPGCRNPRDATRITGGSSGGSAAAVASGVVPLALGTDTGGSVRNPAALCGVIGIKTAADSLPMTGVAPLAPTQDTLGVFGTSARDCMLALEALGAADPASRAPRSVALLTDPWALRVQPEVGAALDDAARRLRATGIELAEVALRHSELATAASYVIMLAESARQWWHGDGPPPGSLGRDVHGLLRLGTQVTDADYRRALEVRAAIGRELRATLGKVDALLLASCPVEAAVLGERLIDCAGRKVPVEAANAALTALASVSGLPAISVPAVGAPGSLPIGVQMIGSGTATLGALAEMLEADRL
ncbi:MAG: amidase [Sciscionella sp.]